MSHGHPIPDKDEYLSRKVETLSELKARDKGIIVNVFEEDPKMLQYSWLHWIDPRCCVRSMKSAIRGPLIVCVSGSRYALGKEVASKNKSKIVKKIK